MEPTQSQLLIGSLIVIFVSVAFVNLALGLHFGSLRTAVSYIKKGISQRDYFSLARKEISEISTFNLTMIFISVWGFILGIIFCLGSLFYTDFVLIYAPLLIFGVGGAVILIGLSEVIKKENYGLFKLRGIAAIMEGGFFVLGGFGMCVIGILAWIKN